MGREADTSGIGRTDPLAVRARNVPKAPADAAGHRSPDVREEADADLGHGEEVAVAGDAMAAMDGEADAAAMTMPSISET